MHRDNQEAARASAPQSGVADESIPKPRRKSEITIAQIHRHMNLGGSQHDREWLNIRNSVQDSVGAAHFNWDYTWKDQKSTKISNALADVEKNIPEFRRFVLSWGALYVIQGFFSGHSSYENTKDNTATYNGRRRMRRQQQHAAAHSPPPNAEYATNQHGAGPSHTSRCTPDGGDDDSGAATAASSFGVEVAGRLPRLPGDESSELESESSNASSSDSESGSDS
ncbi:hypothetical protein BOTBODRAFT_39796 [Botryobasidium botryosum FD-172 SS1]|uniref:Uncharacterized protein n=1 Tax=Botryobasidium botryosum (strain FD-172 SS1) TaxID=930990 RepID=A0A067LSA7_BOTB1|nr:hypothetical protein BOTBODRAFT_39796 [Botryobasidium botryosum FD-172 SS1]